MMQFENCDFWTADRHFYNAAQSHYNSVRWIGGNADMVGGEFEMWLLR
ncbi:MAG: hypothetical protein QGG64_22240 [Candidatus Latescibacteria bacterium]|jgi:hypothetical protein|nr:hypothetical protein [Candidatus Latescibacterota bacterium]